MKSTMTIHKPYMIGMIHLPPTLRYAGWPGIEQVIAKARKDLESLQNAGFNAALIENDEDSPCKVTGTPDVIAPMAIVTHELSKISKIPLGVEVLLNDSQASLAIAKTCEIQFIRTDFFVDDMTREGYGQFNIDPEAVNAYKKQIHAENVLVLADLQVKYAKMMNTTKSLTQSAQEALNMHADAVVVTGSQTGESPIEADLKEVYTAVAGKIPVLVGSGCDAHNVQTIMQYADGAIVGTSIKSGSYIDQNKAQELIQKLRR